MRVGFVLRSAEIKPSFFDLLDHSLTKQTNQRTCSFLYEPAPAAPPNIQNIGTRLPTFVSALQGARCVAVLAQCCVPHTPKRVMTRHTTNKRATTANASEHLGGPTMPRIFFHHHLQFHTSPDTTFSHSPFISREFQFYIPHLNVDK